MVTRNDVPPPPGNCNASMNAIFIEIRTHDSTNYCLHSPRACHFTTGVPIDSGRIIHRSGLTPGEPTEVYGSFETKALERTGLFPKSNRMTHPPHSVKVETQVMQGI